MIYRAHVPRWPLRDFVQQLWYCEGYQPSHAKERVLPDGTLQIIISLRDATVPSFGGASHQWTARLPGCIVSGPRSCFQVIGTAGMKAVAGVHFKPGGAAPFLDLPMGELAGLDVPLDALWGSLANELRERAVGAASPEALFRVLEEVLLSRAGRKLALNSSVIAAVEDFDKGARSPSIAAVVDQSGRSHRHFIGVFRDAVGLTPKVFARVRRFQHALRCVAGGRPVSWPDVALNCGYYDQAHFIHDFHAFSGLNPTAYLENRGAWATHVPIHD